MPKSIRATIIGLALLIAGEAHAGSIKLSWQDNSDNETKFEIQRKLGTSGTYAKIGEVAANVVNYTDATLIDATLYCYRVRATNDAGQSGWSNEACARTAAPVPLTPSNLKATP